MTRCLSPLSAVLPACVALVMAISQPAMAQSFPVSIEHRFGTAVIELQPERVASIEFTGADNLLALGVQPVLVRTWPGEPAVAAWAEPLLERKPVVLHGAIDYEAIASARPDVIIALWSGMTRADYVRLAAIDGDPQTPVPDG